MHTPSHEINLLAGTGFEPTFADAARDRELARMAEANARDPVYVAAARERRIASLTAAILKCNAEHVEFTDKAIRRTAQGEIELAEIFTSRATAAMSRAIQLSDERAALVTERAGLSIPVLEPISATVRQLNPAMWPNLPCDVEAAE